MRKRAAAAELKVKAEEKKPKIVAKHEIFEEEESEGEEELEEVEVSDTEQVNEDDEEEVEYEEVEEEVEVEEEEEEEEDQEEEEEEEEEDEASKKETLRKLLEPLPIEKIIAFFKEAALNDPSIVANLTQTSEVDPAHREIFVFGLGWDATADQVLSVFKQYGDIEECRVVTDKVTGKAKGYGFVLFKTRESADTPQTDTKEDRKPHGYLPISFYRKALKSPLRFLMVVSYSADKLFMVNVNSIYSTPQSFGLGAGYGMNTVSPSMIATYGLGAYQHPQVGRSSAPGTTPAPAARQQSGIGSLGTSLPSYLGR
ncbi:UBP1-associated protein 2A-like protein [Tanacetum coccineum]|uniref:UBP1-associated protein 2A-like protein n=1 Tax=Tanacetum coccineum TaxID=301880 RepID=A0ABQ4X777_9ASTR